MIKTPPGPKGIPFFGNFFQATRNPLHFQRWCAREFGPVVFFRFFGARMYLFTDPQDIEYVLLKGQDNFLKDQGTKRLSDILGQGLLVSDGSFWKRQRHLAQPAFNHVRVQKYATLMVQYTRGMLEEWKSGQTLDIHEAMMEVTLRIVAKALLDTEVSSEARTIRESLERFMQHATTAEHFLKPLSRLPTPNNIRFWRALREFNKILFRIIEKRRKQGVDVGDLLSMLMLAEDEDGDHMTDRQLRDEVATLVLAGHETTALTLSYAWRLLALNPDTTRKLNAEVDEVLQGRAPTFEDIPRLPYIEGIVNESMRLFPPAWNMGREVKKDFEIHGYHIPAKSTIIISQWVCHQDPQYFKDPKAFRPERWANDFAKKIPRFAFFPFGGGPRICIGFGFARMEAALILATMAQRFELQLVPEQKFGLMPMVTLRPRYPINMTLMSRT